MHELLKQQTALTLLQREIQQWQASSTPKYLTQARQYLQNATSLEFGYHRQSQVLIRVTMMLIQVSSPATLVIQDRSWPVNGFFPLYLGEAGLLIRPEDQVLLTQTTAGPLSLEWLGEEMYDRGKRS